MLSGDGNENGKISKYIFINRSNKQKKNTALHVQHTFCKISLPLFCTTTETS